VKEHRVVKDYHPVDGIQTVVDAKKTGNFGGEVPAKTIRSETLRINSSI